MGAIPSHEQLDTNFNVPFNGNTMDHIDNSINGIQSSHLILREIFIDLVTGIKTDPRNIYFIEYLNESQVKELRSYLDRYNVPLDWNWTLEDIRNPHDENYDRFPVNEESKRKFEIEKKYLFHWLDKVATGELRDMNDVSVLNDDNIFITDGERIADLYRKNIYNKLTSNKN